MSEERVRELRRAGHSIWKIGQTLGLSADEVRDHLYPVPPIPARFRDLASYRASERRKQEEEAAVDALCAVGRSHAAKTMTGPREADIEDARRVMDKVFA